MQRTRRSRFAGGSACAGLAAALVAGALAATVPAASPDGHGKGSGAGSDHVPPGQAKKALPAVAAAAPAPPTEAVAAAAVPAGAASSKLPKGNGASNPGAKAKQRQVPPGQAKRATAAAPAAATPAPAIVAPAPAAAASPAAAVPPPPAAPVSRPATPRRTSAATRRARERARAAARRAAQARRAPGPPPVSAVPVGVTPASTPRAPVPAMSSDPADGSAAGADSGTPLARTVVRVLEVIPPGVRIALGVLALLGLLLGAFAARQTVRSRRLARQRRMLLADVGVLQSALLPDFPERIGGARVTAAYRPAAGLAAGGDFYDAFELAGGRTGVIVGDVAGHGRDAVPLTALVRYNLRAYLEAGLAPRATLHVGSNVLAPQLGGLQVTVVVAIFDPGTGRLTYACAGHPPPLLLGTSAALVTAASSPPIGAGAPTGRRQTTVALAPGAAACFITDGLTDVPVAQGARLGHDGVVAELKAVGPDGDAEDLVARVLRRSTRQPDDIAACMLTALPGGAATWSLQLEELEADEAMLRQGWVERFLLACGASGAQVGRALAEAREMVDLAGTAIVEVRIGEELREIRVSPPAAVSMPIGRRQAAAPDDLAATG